MIERPDIDALMAGELGRWLEEQTLARKAAREKSSRRLVISTFVLLPALAFLWFGPAWGPEIKGLISLAAVGVAAVWIYAPLSKAIEDTKHGINAGLAGALGLEYHHRFEPGAGFERARKFQMVPGFQRSGFEDLWAGELAGRAFTLHEAELKQRRRRGKNTHYVTVFRGPVMTITFDRAFHGVTLVERAGKHLSFGFFSGRDSIRLDGRELDLVDMVHPEFEDEFTIYSTDQVEARTIVHPAYVERLIALERAFSGKKIRALFYEGELTVVLETDNMFESGTLDAGRDREMVTACVDQFMSMADLAAALNEPAR